MTRVLVTGASGLIGRALVRRLESDSIEVIGLNSGLGDIGNPDTLNAIGGEAVDRVFHLAGRTYVPHSWDDPVQFLRVNTHGTATVAEYCRKNAIPLTYVSAYLYGKPERLPIPETAPIKPNNPYALSKYLAEQICRFYADMHKTAITVIRPFNVYGVGQDEKFLIPTIIKQVRSSDVIRVKDLKPKRDYVYLGDLVEALILTLNHTAGYRVYNIGSGTSLSVAEIVDVIQSVANTQKRVVSDDEDRTNELDDVVADIGKASRELGWFPRVAFQQGIEKILQAEPRC